MRAVFVSVPVRKVPGKNVPGKDIEVTSVRLKACVPVKLVRFQTTGPVPVHPSEQLTNVAWAVGKVSVTTAFAVSGPALVMLRV
jgi:hypothetical protein